MTTTLPAATQGQSYSVPLAAEGGVAPYQWVTAEPLPGGLTIGSSSGVISGIPAGSGTFTVTVQVTDAQVPAALSRQTMSLQVSPATTTTVNRPPVVTMESPSAATTVKFGKSQRLSAAASDTDGSVVRVDFFADTTRIATAVTAPYSATWRPARGTYSLTAVAVDNGGASTRSAAVQVTVR
ncbi:MAG: Ig-like domain-containing protein [Acidobacteria bacterium]|nr:Ig-like domain-containing protein [Acidobacteriota bacterium]